MIEALVNSNYTVFFFQLDVGVPHKRNLTVPSKVRGSGHKSDRGPR